MKFSITVRASTKDAAAESVPDALGVFSAAAGFEVDWTRIIAAAATLIGTLDDSETLDVVCSLSGDVATSDDASHHCQLSAECMLTDRVA